MSNVRTRVRFRPDPTQGALHRGTKFPSFLLAIIIFAAVSGILGLADDKLSWELLTVATITAALAASDAVDAVLRRRDIFSPRVLVSLLIVNAVYVSPILHVALDIMPSNLALPVNVDNALLELAILQFLGVGVYFVSLRILNPERSNLRGKVEYAQEDPGLLRSLRGWSLTFALLSIAAFGYIVLSSGGPMAWLNAQLNYRTEVDTSGWMLAAGSAFPTLFFIAYVVTLKINRVNLSHTEIRNRVLIAIFALILITFVINGLRGSRANLIWPTLSGLIMVHLLFFRFRMKWIALIAALALTFSGIYDVYKKAGTDGIEQLQSGTFESSEGYSELGFGPQAMLLGDFSRTAMQAIILDRWNSTGFELSLGRTYIGDALEFVPGAESSTIFPNKRYAATDILYGQGSSESRSQLSSRIFGLQGEALMNFGPVGAVLIFFPYAILMAWAERGYARARYGRSIRSAIVVAVMIPVIVLLFLSDVDNAINTFTSKALFPLVAIAITNLWGGVRPKHPRMHTRTGRSS